VTERSEIPPDIVTIKKYANRRLYNTSTSTYVTLDDLADMVKEGIEFVVYDAKTGDDITRSVLTQIIFEEESKGQSLLPIRFLRQLIRFYGDSMQALVPSYLEHSIETLTREQEKLRRQFADAFGGDPFRAMENQAKQNLAMFEKALGMWMPFGDPSSRDERRDEGSGAGEHENADQATATAPETPTTDDLKALREQLERMQKQLDELAKKS